MLALQNAAARPLNGLNQTHNKTKNVISNLDQLFENILKAFEICPEIQQALIMLGSTPVTPKESYLIRLPHICPEAENVSLKSSKQALFRHLIAEEVLSGNASLGPTNVYLVLSAPHSSALPGFVPKTTFKVPSRGYCLTLNMICSQPSFCAQDLTMDDTEVEISGVEPFERSSFADISLPEVACHIKSPSPDKMARLLSGFDACRYLRVRQASGSDMGEGLKLEGEMEKIQFNTPLTRSTPKVGYTRLVTCDHIWFQCSTVIKGYRF